MAYGRKKKRKTRKKGLRTEKPIMSSHLQHKPQVTLKTAHKKGTKSANRELCRFQNWLELLDTLN